MGKLAIPLLFLITFFLVLVSHILPATSQEVGEQAAVIIMASVVHVNFVYHTHYCEIDDTKHGMGKQTCTALINFKAFMFNFSIHELAYRFLASELQHFKLVSY